MMRVKGSAIAARINYLTKKGGPRAVQKVTEMLSAESRQAITPRVFVSQWYAYECFIEITRLIDQVLGKGDLGLVEEMGRYSAEEALKGIYQVFFQVGSTGFILKRAAAAWRRYYSDGRVVIRKEHERQYRVTLVDLEKPTMEQCLSVMGWIYQALAMSGVKEIKHRISKSPAAGDKDYEYIFSWQ